MSETNTSAVAAPDPFDPEKLRLSQDFLSSTGVTKLLLTVPVRKPAMEWFVRTHPSKEYRLQTGILELKEDREIYLVLRELWAGLAGEKTFSPRELITAVNRQGVVFVWPVRLPGPDGRIDNWSASALEAANRAQKSWVRVTANMNLGAYDVFEACGQFPEPQWPDVPFKKLLGTAFKKNVIDTPDHPVLKRLRGEA